MATIQSETGRIGAHNYPLQNSLSYLRKDPRESIQSTPHQIIKHKEKRVSEIGLSFRPGRVNILLKKGAYQLILIGDMNKYILSYKVRTFFTKLGLYRLIINRHGSVGPDTTRTNKKRQAIDGIWGSQGIYIMKGGYLPLYFGEKSD